MNGRNPHPTCRTRTGIEAADFFSDARTPRAEANLPQGDSIPPHPIQNPGRTLRNGNACRLRNLSHDRRNKRRRHLRWKDPQGGLIEVERRTSRKIHGQTVLGLPGTPAGSPAFRVIRSNRPGGPAERACNRKGRGLTAVSGGGPTLPAGTGIAADGHDALEQACENKHYAEPQPFTVEEVHGRRPSTVRAGVPIEAALPVKNSAHSFYVLPRRIPLTRRSGQGGPWG